MRPPSVPRPPGRPKSEAKRTAILQAARQLFVAATYESVTMDKIAAAAGVAKMTVYGHFQDKESVFEAMVRSNSDMMIAALPTMATRGGDIQADLVAFGEAFLRVLLAPDVVNAMHRHVDMLSRNPGLARRVFDAGPGRTRAMLAAYLSSDAGLALPQADSIEAASDLMSLWLGDLQQQTAFGLSPPLTPEAISLRVRRRTEVFLRAYQLNR